MMDYVIAFTGIVITVMLVAQRLSVIRNNDIEDVNNSLKVKDNSQKSYIQLLEDRIRRLESEKESLHRQIIDLHINIAQTQGINPTQVLQSLVAADIGMMWVKERIGPKKYTMLCVSLKYANLYLGGPVQLYNNKSDEEIFGKKPAELYTANDELVYVEQKGRHVKERIQGAPTGITGYFVGRKFPLRLPDDRDFIVGIGEHIYDDHGYALANEDSTED